MLLEHFLPFDNQELKIYVSPIVFLSNFSHKFRTYSVVLLHSVITKNDANYTINTLLNDFLFNTATCFQYKTISNSFRSNILGKLDHNFFQFLVLTF